MYESIIKSYYKIQPFIKKTPLEFNERLSKLYNANIFLKREDLQKTRSFKIRGSLNKILKETDSGNKKKHIVCASAGNHAQGVSYVANLLGLKSSIYVPTITPPQKLSRIKSFSNEEMELIKYGDNFDECLEEALNFSKSNDFLFIHPYNDYDIIEGQGTIGYEINKDIDPDIILTCIGGGGLISGLLNYYEGNIQIYGAEPENADSMNQALINDKPVRISNFDTFVDGASVRKIGDLTFNITRNYLNSKDIKIINNGLLCNEMIKLYQDDGIITEPAGCLSVAALNLLDKEKIKNKNIVCLISGGNNDIMRYPEILEKNLIYLKIKHYYIIEFSQKPKELKNFILNVLGENDDITRFEYIKKTNKNYGNVLVGIETKNNHVIESKLFEYNFRFRKINEND